MPEGGGQDRTEQATPQKLRKAREKGQVWQSKELTSIVSFAAMLVALVSQAETIGDQLQTIGQACINSAGGEIDASTLWTALTSCVAVGFMLIALPLLVGLVVGVLTAFVQVGALVATDPLIPKLSRLNPVEGLKQKFFSVSAYVELLKSILKITTIGFVAYLIGRAAMPAIIRLPLATPADAVQLTEWIAVRLGAWCVGLGLAFSAADLLFQRWNYMRNQRMTKEEVKREYRDQEGDPQIKSRRRRAHEEALQGQMFAAARKADVMVVNPTHIACALTWDGSRDRAPTLLAKGQGWIAAELRKIAEEEDIPVVRDPSLARALHELEIDDEIPEALFDSVAELLRWVEQLARAEGRVPNWLAQVPSYARGIGDVVGPSGLGAAEEDEENSV